MADSILKIDIKDNKVRQIVHAVYHNILSEYIAPANQRAVLNDLYKFYTESDLTLIHKVHLKQYQEMEKTILSPDLFKVNNNG